MVIIFCGVPGSGKSTIARKLVEPLEEKGSVRLFVSDQIPGQRYKKISKLLKENLDKVDYILLDGTFYKKVWREEVKKIAGKDNVFICYLYCSLKTCLERNQERKPSLPERVIHIINAEMEKPEKPDVIIDTDEIEPKEAVNQVLNEIIKRR